MARYDGFLGYALSVFVTGTATAICFLMYGHFALSNLVMIYLVGVVVIASRFGPKEAVFTSVLSTVAFDFLFVPPRWTFAVSHTQDLLTLAVMVGVALVIGTLTVKVREHAEVASRASGDATAERIRSTLLASISHDLRTPLTSIAGAADTLRRGIGDPEALTSTIYEESQRLNRKVQNLLDMTRLESDGVKLGLEWQSVEELLGSALHQTRELLGNRRVVLRIPEDLPLVRADGTLIDSVFVNLLENVARHTPEDAKLEIAAEVQGDKVLVSFFDEGPGIPSGQEEAIFARFSRLSESPKGVGLGLAICRGILKLHGGTIAAGSRPEGGAVFKVELPLTTTQPEVIRD